MCMKSSLFVKIGLISAILGMCSTLSVAAQDFDDIYYNPSKEKKTENKVKTVKKTQQTTTTYYNPGTSYTEATRANFVDYPAADTYAPSGGLDIDVDVYNRHGLSQTASSVDSLYDNDEFAYTRRIERFHNPDVVVNTKDEELIEYYYETEPASQSTVNIYVNNSPWWNWNSPYYYSSWAWRPYYNTFWGPSWSWGFYDPWYSWSWGWGPSWSWNWGPSWGWGPGWYPGWNRPWNPGPGHGPGSWAYNPPRPSSPGASRPHGWATNNGSNSMRPGTSSSYRPSTNVGHLTGTNANAARPGSRGRLTGTSTGVETTSPANRWPANVNTVGKANTTTRPASSSVNNAGTVSGRGRTTTPSATTTTPARNNNNYTPSRPSSSSSAGNYSGSSNSHRSTGGGSFGGGSHSGGAGGSGRGRR